MPDRPRIAHVGIAVPDIDAALAFYRDVLGLEPAPARTADGATIVALPFGDSEVELLAPLAPDSSDRQVPGQARSRHSPHLLPGARPRRGARAPAAPPATV